MNGASHVLYSLSQMKAQDARKLFGKLQDCYSRELQIMDIGKGDTFDLCMVRAIATCKYVIDNEEEE